MTKILLGRSEQGDVRLDLESLMQYGMLVQGRSGSGKTTVLRRILEQSHGHVQQLVIDPEGEFYTLREKFDYVIAGKGGDCAVDPRSAKLLARRLLELGVSAVCDLYELKMPDRIRFVRHFCEALIDAPRNVRTRPVLVVVDEAHLFAPEKGQAESAAAVIDLNARGRKRGIRPIFATQRLAKLDKDAADLGNKLVGATGIDLDQQRAGDDLGFTKAERMALRDLPRGVFYAYGPALTAGVTRITVGDTETKNPSVGHELAAPAAPTAKIRTLLAKVADLPAEAEAEARDNESLRRELGETRRKLTMAEKTQRVEQQPCDHERELANMHDAIVERDQRIEIEVEARETFRHHFTQAEQRLKAVADVLGAPLPRLPEVDNFTPPKPPQLKKPAQARQQYIAPKPSTNGHAPVGDLSSPQQRVVDAAGALHAFGLEEIAGATLAAHANYRYSGGFRSILSELRGLGLIEDVRPKVHRLTAAGEAEANVEPIGGIEELRERWLALCSNSTRPLLQVLIEEYPNMISGPDLARRCDREYSGGFRNLMSELCTMSAATRPAAGHLRAADVLFPERVST